MTRKEALADARMYDRDRKPAPEWLKIPLVTAQIDHAAEDRLAAGVAEYRAQVGEARWAQLQREWEA